jgi:dimethylaniline monooxygenase (N-oxide forming)
MPDFPSGKQVQQYLESYAEVFDIRRHIQTNTRVVQVVRNDDDTKWIVRVLEDGQDKKAIEFDKVAVCIGAWVHPKLPQFEGKDMFKGEVMHSREVKRPTDFTGKRVVVLGLGNTAADTSTTLVGHASQIHLSHRRGANLVSTSALRVWYMKTKVRSYLE